MNPAKELYINCSRLTVNNIDLYLISKPDSTYHGAKK